MVKYLSIYQEIKKRILSSQYPTDQKLPDGKKLADEFECSELTIKKALDILVKEGYIVRKRGSGSYVKRPGHSHEIGHLNGTKYRNEIKGKTITTNVIHFSAIPADDEIVQKLRCQLGDLVYNIIRVRKINGIPTIIEYTYMPTSVIPGLTSKQVEESIYNYIQHDLKLTIHSSDMKISITESSPEEQELLELQAPEKLATVDQTAFLDNGQLFEYSTAKHLWHAFEFTTTYVKS